MANAIELKSNVSIDFERGWGRQYHLAVPPALRLASANAASFNLKPKRKTTKTKIHPLTRGGLILRKRLWSKMALPRTATNPGSFSQCGVHIISQGSQCKSSLMEWSKIKLCVCQPPPPPPPTGFWCDFDCRCPPQGIVGRAIRFIFPINWLR